MYCAFGSVNEDVHTSGVAQHVGEGVPHLSANFHLRDDVHVVWNGHRDAVAIVIGAMVHNRLCNRRHGACRANPAHHRLVPDTHRHDVVAR